MMTMIAILAFLCAVFTFGLMYRYLITGANVYEQKFVDNIGSKMRDSFVFYNPKRVFVLTLLGASVAAVLSYIFIGIIGTFVTAMLVAVLPNLIVNYMRKKRMSTFIYQLPDCLGAMGASLRAGSNLSRAIEQASRQQPAPMSQELSLVMAEYKVGRKLEDAIHNMYKRMPEPEVELLNSAVAIAGAVGGNLAETFDTLADTLRAKAQIEGKIDALTAQGKMQGWVAAMLPVAVAFILFKQEPVAMTALYSELVGWITLGVLAIMMFIALIIIRKIVNIDV